MTTLNACETSEMLAKLCKGDADAFALLVECHERMIASLAQSHGFSGAQLEDAVAEVFAEIFQSLPGFVGQSRLRTWIYTIAFRTVCRLRQKVARGGTVPLHDQGDALFNPDHLTPATAAANAELHERLWSAVAKLDERSSTVVELHYRQQLPLAEIASVLECPVGTVKTLLHRARETLRTSIELRDEVR